MPYIELILFYFINFVFYIVF